MPLATNRSGPAWADGSRLSGGDGRTQRAQTSPWSFSRQREKVARSAGGGASELPGSAVEKCGAAFG
ncbi:hypothetical protein XFF6990_430013 [Xanthomonas citri pv. fuscans]|nr:hypothetical protein XFF6990_430013 [Xanthomonas citri pv. fuscans]